MTSPAYTFTDAQLVDIRRFCGYPARGDGSMVFPYPWIMRQYLALDVRLQNLTASEATVITSVYLANLYSLETGIVDAAANLDTDSAAIWVHNKHEIRDRSALFDAWRRRLCDFVGIQPGPALGDGGLTLVV